MSVANFDEIKEQYLLNIMATVSIEEIPYELILNWDQTGLHVVPGSKWTMEKQGSNRVEIAEKDDKHQIIAVICGSLKGKLLPFQIIYQGTTKACIPKCTCIPPSWHLTYSYNHWSNVEKMM